MRSAAILVVVAGLVGASQSLTEVFDRAAASLSKGEYAAAEAGFQRILQASPNHVDSLLNLGVIYSRTARTELAVATYRHALELSPRNQTALLNLGLVHLRQKAYGEALAAFQDLVDLDPASPPMRDVRLLFSLSDGYLKENSSSEAKRKLDTFLARVPPAAANLVLCKLYLASDRIAEAELRCRRTLELDPIFPGAHLELARALAGEHSLEADKELAAAIQEKPEDPEAVYDLGAVLLQAGRIEEARPYLERAQALNPEFWGAYFQLAKIWLQLGQPDRAVPLLQRAAELNGTSFSLYYELGRALIAIGNTREAGRAMARARELMALELEKDAQLLRKK